MTETVKRVRRGSIVYTDKWRGYDSLMFFGYKHFNIDHRYKFQQGKVYINGIEGYPGTPTISMPWGTGSDKPVTGKWI